MLVATSSRTLVSENLKRRSLLSRVTVFCFCQDNESMSSYGVMRGLHFQCPPYTQSNLVHCVKGRVLDDTLGIDWKIPTEHANLSEKDTKHVMLKDFDSLFDFNVDLYK